MNNLDKISILMASLAVSISPVVANVNFEKSDSVAYRIAGEDLTEVANFFNKEGIGVRVLDSERGDYIIEFVRNTLSPELIKERKFRISFESYGQEYKEYAVESVYPEDVMTEEFVLSARRCPPSIMGEFLMARRCPPTSASEFLAARRCPPSMSEYMAARRCPPTMGGEFLMARRCPPSLASEFLAARRCPPSMEVDFMAARRCPPSQSDIY